MMHGSNADEMMRPKRRWGLIVWVLPAIALGSGLFLAIRKNDQSVHAISKQTDEMLGRVTIPEFELHEVTLDETIAHLNRVVAERGLSRVLHFERWQSREPPKGFIKSERPTLTSVPATPNLEVLPGSSSTDIQPTREDVRYSISLADVPLPEALRYVSVLFDCVTGERGHTIFLVHERGAFGPMLERTFRVHPGIGIGLPTVGGKLDAKPFFRSQGVTFYEGSDAYVLPGGKLIVRNVQDGIDLISAIVGNPEPSTLMRIKWWLMDSWGRVRTPFSYP